MKKNKITNWLFFLSLLLIFYSCKEKTTIEIVEEISNSNDSNECNKLSIKLAKKNDYKSIDIVNNYFKKDTVKLFNVYENLIEYYKLNFDDIDNNEKKVCSLNLLKMFSPKSSSSLSNVSKFYLMFNALKPNDNYNEVDESKENFDAVLSNILVSYKEEGLEYIINKWENNKDFDFIIKLILMFEKTGIDYLSKSIIINEDHKEILAHFGESAVGKLTSMLKDENREIRFSAAEVLVKMIKFHPEAIKTLTNAINDENISMISSNYPFYIRLGAVDSEDLLLRALSADFSEIMALDFLNCGNSYIEDKTVIIAKRNGYNVTSGIGMHTGPRWAENKEN